MDTIFDPNSARDRLARELLERIADKWTLLLIEALEDGAPKRFTRIQQQVGGVSQKMLTKTLRQLERDGLVTRHVHPVVPPHVDYQLTASGASLGEAACAIWNWVDAHAESVARARASSGGTSAGADSAVDAVADAAADGQP
ncbi:MAG TPA: helix-turn-helix domain-containing protein [Gemmatimonas sp.]|uniref:winged helix-turn-helix transcriptional regulator n=1 Tax=Gemmatimonas sp. TaxID=1962908 RepID=UPI002ED7BFEB